jgi:hypothetical protein
MNCCVPLGATEAVAGVTAIDTKGFVTVSVAELETIPFCVAVMLEVDPGVTPVATPLTVIVAPEVAAHVTVEVMFFLLPSAKVPVAVNCWVALGATVAVVGATAMETRGTPDTVSVVEPVTPLEAAEIVVVPAPTPVARPEAVMLATDGLDEAQVAVEVRTFVLPSLYVPVAVNCWVFPAAIDGFAGVTAMETSVTEVAVTVSVVEPTTPPEVAVMLLVPAATAVARPDVPMVATEDVTEAQLAVAVRSFVVLSLYVPVALNCCVAPAVIDGLDGVTAMETSVTVGGGVLDEPALPPQPTNKLTPSNRNASSNRFIQSPRGSYAPNSAFTK